MPDSERGAPAPTDADVRLGERLRRVRTQQGLSLHEVEEASGREIKASVLGAYERGERSLSLTRLRTLADFYRVPMSELMPSPDPAARAPTTSRPRMVIDLVALEEHRDELPALARYVDGIRSLRGDHYGRVLTVRTEDLRTLAAVTGTTPQALVEEFEVARLVP